MIRRVAREMVLQSLFQMDFTQAAPSLSQAQRLKKLSQEGGCTLEAMQDILGLGGEARMNTPSTVGGNWQWRARKEDINSENFKMLRYLTKLYSRMRKD